MGNRQLVTAFPESLRADAVAAARALPRSRVGPHGSFKVLVDGEPMEIPERIYNAEPPSAGLRRWFSRSLSPAQVTLLDCLYSRHHDGFVRQKHLRAVLGSNEIWTAPFVLKLIGEYVLPIVEDIAAALAADPVKREILRRFAHENAAFLELTRQRATSYWNEYYRSEFPDPAGYPGLAAIALLEG